MVVKDKIEYISTKNETDFYVEKVGSGACRICSYFSGSGSVLAKNSGSDRIRIHITDIQNCEQSLH
jgi:hypothetical protein